MAVNLYFIVILAAILADYLLDVIASLLNLKAAGNELPPELDSVYTAEQHDRSRDYVRVATRFGLVEGTFDLAILLSFWLAGGFGFLQRLVQGWALPPISDGLVYVAIIGAAYGVLKLPFSIYGTFVIEGRFGFNRTTPRIFVQDMVKGLVLGMVLGGPLAAGVLALFTYAGNYAWLICWGGFIIVSLIMQYVAPVWIMPLFNKFTPMEAGELKEAILAYARSVNFPVRNVYVMDSSKRTSRGNAFFTGFGKNKRIALFDTLIEQHSVPEIVAVLAHEIGHYRKKHIPQGAAIDILHSGLVLFLASLFVHSAGLYRAFGVGEQPVYAGLMFFGLLYTPLEMFISIGLQVVSRRQELEADRFAAETVDRPLTVVEALKKLLATNLSNMTPHPFYVFLNYSHPPLLDRVRAIRAVAEKRKPAA